jgi:hypothetical protein
MCILCPSARQGPDLEHRVELRQGRLAAHQEAAPDQGADPPQGDAELVDDGVDAELTHGDRAYRDLHTKASSPPGI